MIMPMLNRRGSNVHIPFLAKIIASIQVQQNFHEPPEILKANPDSFSDYSKGKDDTNYLLEIAGNIRTTTPFKNLRVPWGYIENISDSSLMIV